MSPHLNSYQNTQFMTARPEQILVLLYDGAIRFICQARQALAIGEKVVKAEKISRALAIISTLSDTLNHEIGGETAENLDALYNFMIMELIKANINDDLKRLETVEDLLSGLRKTWVEAIKIRQQQSSARKSGETIARQGEQRPAASL